MASAVTGMADEDLLKADTEVNAANDEGMTALMLLAQHGEPDEIKTQSKAGADAHMKDQEGRTVLDYIQAASCGSSIVHERDSDEWLSDIYDVMRLTIRIIKPRPVQAQKQHVPPCLHNRQRRSASKRRISHYSR